jgi:hypothetical protein
MTCFQRLTKSFKKFKQDRRGVALLIVLSAMATLAVFVGEITYTAQINQKLAYDRLDQVKAQALAKSGLKLALLRIRAYSEIKKAIGAATGGNAAAAAAASSMIPKAIIEKIWSEPITIPFSGDISSLPSAAKDALGKFRKDSAMEGKLYISIEAQSDKFNLNSILPAFASIAGASPTASPGAPTNAPGTTATASPSPTGTPTASYDPVQARVLFLDHMKTIFQKKFDSDEKFREFYRNYRVEDLVEDILGWSDLSYDSTREQSAIIPFKKAPFYNISELNYLLSVDDDVYNLLASQFTASIGSAINVNAIKEPVLRALVPQMTDDEVKKFFEFRDSTGTEVSTTSAQQASGDDNSFKTADDFFKYLKDKVAAFANSDSKITDLKNALTERGIQITTDESNFLVHIEATVQQTKRTLEAMVSITGNSTASTGAPGATGSVTPSPTPPPTNNAASSAAGIYDTNVEKSNLKITQLRFL